VSAIREAARAPGAQEMVQGRSADYVCIMWRVSCSPLPQSMLDWHAPISGLPVVGAAAFYDALPPAGKARCEVVARADGEAFLHTVCLQAPRCHVLCLAIQLGSVAGLLLWSSGVLERIMLQVVG